MDNTTSGDLTTDYRAVLHPAIGARRGAIVVGDHAAQQNNLHRDPRPRTLIEECYMPARHRHSTSDR